MASFRRMLEHRAQPKQPITMEILETPISNTTSLTNLDRLSTTQKWVGPSMLFSSHLSMPAKSAFQVKAWEFERIVF